MKPGAIRSIDELGRIAIPIDMRNRMRWGPKTQILVLQQEGHLVLQTYQDNCCLCNSEINIKKVNDVFICQNCIDQINE